MSSAIDKSKIIEAIQNTDDERILFAINRLLQIEEDFPQSHAGILEERLSAIETGKAEFFDWEKVKSSLFKDAQ